MLKIDIDGQPPTQDEIDAEWKRRKKKLRITSAVEVVVGVISIIVALYAYQSIDHSSITDELHQVFVSVVFLSLATDVVGVVAAVVAVDVDAVGIGVVGFVVATVAVAAVVGVATVVVAVDVDAVGIAAVDVGVGVGVCVGIVGYGVAAILYITNEIIESLAELGTYTNYERLAAIKAKNDAVERYLDALSKQGREITKVEYTTIKEQLDNRIESKLQAASRSEVYGK